MSDANAGAAAGAAAGQAAGAAGAGAGAAAGAAAGAGAAAAPAPAWHGLPETDAEGVAYIANKGWKAPADVIKSYQGAEKLIGKDPSQLLVMPRADDPAGFRAVFAKLGMPETPDKYEFAKPADGIAADASYEAFARGAFHEAGLTASMAKTLTAKHNEYVKSVIEQQTKDYNLSVETDKKALLAEWKGGHERMKNAAESAAKALGFTPEMIDGIEKTVGYAGTWKFFADLGKKMGEDNFVLGKDKGGQFAGSLTPAEAKVQAQAMERDPTTVAALKDVMHPQHKAMKAKRDELYKVMYPT